MANEFTPIAVYEGGATFTWRCPLCGRFVKADDTTTMNEAKPNATCTKDGRVRMEFEGWYE